ncbi:unnamed protein product [Lactuca virosa]|uniref:Uncharacterized protein n=1 Tax=Lactuca virosa TaxID=75947 RepID=A0AAU9P437_9ASTR|nr:unnamed protein product [Lactuca virosa]
MPRDNLEPDTYDPIPDASIPDGVAPVQQEHAMHPHHEMYMQEFQCLHTNYQRLHRDYSDLYDSACEMNTEMVELREDLYSFRESQQTHNKHVDTLCNDPNSNPSSRLAFVSRILIFLSEFVSFMIKFNKENNINK